MERLPATQRSSRQVVDRRRGAEALQQLERERVVRLLRQCDVQLRHLELTPQVLIGGPQLRERVPEHGERLHPDAP
jgi:hypothetical protein